MGRIFSDNWLGSYHKEEEGKKIISAGTSDGLFRFNMNCAC